MTPITLYLDAETEAGLRAASEELGRSVEDLANCAVAETVLDYFRSKPMDADPGRVIERLQGASLQ